MDLKAELELLKTSNLSTVKYSVDFAKEILQRAIAAEADVRRLEEELNRNFKGEIQAKLEVERLNLVVNERIADINAILDDNESQRAMKLATDMAFMEQRKQMEKYRQALNRVLGFVVDCPSHQGLDDGIRPCAEEHFAVQCSKCWKIALGVEEDD